jgi:hypothetical protein
MTPTLTGRIETRIILNLAIAMPILFLFGMANIFFIMLALGISLDLVYTNIQYKRWNGDWPHLYTLISGIIEGAFLWIIVSFISEVSFQRYLFVYTTIWILIFISQAVILNIIFPYRRFLGGKIS